MNKPVASKLITSNNYFSFFVKNVDKLKDEDFIDYFKKLETPHGDYYSFNLWKNKGIFVLTPKEIDALYDAISHVCK